MLVHASESVVDLMIVKVNTCWWQVREAHDGHIYSPY